MIDPKIREILQELPKTSYGQALKIFLDAQYNEISDVSTVVTIEDAKAKQIALKLIKKIFEFYVEKPVVDKNKTMYN